MQPLLLIASTNHGKLLEMQALLGSLPCKLVLPDQIGIRLDVNEDGQTYADNAALKGRAYCQVSGIVTLADDSGLEVDLLGGEPGLHSARYTGSPGSTDADRRRFLLSKLGDKPHPWKAHFHCTVAIAAPGREIQFAEGDCPGEIIAGERGNNGFGYDPIFLLPETGRTMAELNLEEKNELSHRARAVKAAIPILMGLF